MLANFLNDHQSLEQVVLYALLAIIFLLTVLLVIYAARSEKFEKLYEYTNKEARLMARLKNTYEKELKTFANLMDEITFPIWQRNKDMEIIYCNSRFCEITGEIRQNILDKVDVELFRDSKEISLRAMKTNQVQVVEQNIVIAGSNTLSQVVEIPISDKNATFSAKNGTIGFALNLIELQNTRERLKFNLELQKRLLESLNSAVAIYGVNQKLEYYNRAFVDLWKFDEDWLKTYPSYGEILEALREKRKLPEQSDFVSFKRDNLNMFSNLISKKEDYYYLTDGKVLKVIIIPYQNRGLLFYYEDMTQQLSLERRYNTLVSVQKYTLDNLNEAVAVFGEDGKLELYNPNFLNLWSFTESFLKSEPHLSRILDEMMIYYPVDNAANFKEDFIAAMNYHGTSERKMTRKDGVILIERFTALPDGAKLITYFDITDKENVEKSLRAEKKAYEDADRIKTNFLGNVSYELRSPLTSIMGFTEMILMLYSKKLDEKSKEYLSAIHESSIKLKNLIDNIIDVSSLDAGYVSLDIKKMRIGEVMDVVKNLYKGRNNKNNVGVEIDIADNVSTIKADKLRLRQAISAIMDFSIIMSRKDSSVKMNISRAGTMIDFEVVDTGVGIPEKDLPLIFDQFYKLQSDDTQATGLGLYLAKKIIELHDGSIKVESEQGKGTKFTFAIPA